MQAWAYWFRSRMTSTVGRGGDDTRTKSIGTKRRLAPAYLTHGEAALQAPATISAE